MRGTRSAPIFCPSSQSDSVQPRTKSNATGCRTRARLVITDETGAKVSSVLLTGADTRLKSAPSNLCQFSGLVLAKAGTRLVLQCQNMAECSSNRARLCWLPGYWWERQLYLLNLDSVQWSAGNLMVVYSRYTLWTIVLGLCSIFSVDNYDYLGDNYVRSPHSWLDILIFLNLYI